MPEESKSIIPVANNLTLPDLPPLKLAEFMTRMQEQQQSMQLALGQAAVACQIVKNDPRDWREDVTVSQTISHHKRGFLFMKKVGETRVTTRIQVEKSPRY